MRAGDGQLDQALQTRALADARRAAADADGADGARERARDAAQQFEGLLVQTLLKGMRATTPGDGLFSNSGVDQYQQLFDQHLAKDIGNGRGLGLAPMIERQILRQQGIEPETGPALDRGLAAYRPGIPGRPPVAADAPSPAGSGEAIAPPAAPAPKAPPGRAPLAGGPEAFVERLWPQAERIAAELDVDPRALVAQSALETGWGQHVLRHGDGRSSHNVFNIKAHRDWSGETVRVPTLEYRDGAAVREQASFRSYESLEAAFDDYADFLKSHPRYTEALRAGPDAGRYLKALQEAGYATDPAYAEKIERILEQDVLSARPPGLKASADGSTT